MGYKFQLNLNLFSVTISHNFSKHFKIINNNLAGLEERIKKIILDPYKKAKENYLKFYSLMAI